MAADRHDHTEQNPTPSALIMRLMPGPGPADWQVTRRYPDSSPAQTQTPQQIPAPWARDNSFFQTLAGFWQLSRQVLAEASAIQQLHAHAAAVGDQLARVLTDQDRAHLTAPQAGTPFLIIESADKTILSLPWELLRLQDRFAVREGRLDVARSILTDVPPVPAPSTPALTLVMTVAALKPSRLDEAEERYHLLRAVPEPIAPMLNETGEFEELLASVSAAPATFGIHFSGQGDDGQLHFEDASGQGLQLSIDQLQQALRTTAPERQPLFFCLALDPDAAPFSPGAKRHEQPWLARASTALDLHRAGIPQVVVHDRAVLGRAAPVVEPAVWSALYTAIAHGQSTREAVHAARHVLTAPSDNPTRFSELGAAPSVSNGIQPYAWTHLLYFHRGTEYPLCLPMAPRDGDIHHTVSRHTVSRHTVSRSQAATERFRLRAQPLLGRRKALHGLRHLPQTQRAITIVQGAAGIGKTAFCHDALQIYQRLGYAVLTLRCGEVEFDPQPLNTLLWQCTEAASRLAGAQWPALSAMMDEAIADQPDLPSPVTRFLMLLQVLLQRHGESRVVLYLDNLESLLSCPSKGSAARHWRHTNMAELWHALVRSAQENDGQLAILASCRYTHPDLRPYMLPLRPLAPDAVWSLLSGLPALRHLTPDNRHRLLKRVDGYPQLAILLDALLHQTFVDSATAHTSLPTPHAARAEWRQVIAPVLPTQNQPLSEHLLFKAIWNHRLDDAMRCLLARATVLRTPADVSLMHALALEAEDMEAANRLLDHLCACALLEASESDTDRGDAGVHFTVKPGMARFVRQQITQIDTLLQQGHLLAGEVFEDRVWRANSPHAAFEAAYHLGEVGEADRGFELLLELVHWLHSRHRLLDSLTVLDALPWSEALSLHNQARLLTAQGQTYAGLDNVPAALSHLQRAVDLYVALAE